jgi:hypothetical protein
METKKRMGTVIFQSWTAAGCAAALCLAVVSCAGRGPSRETKLAMDMLKGSELEALSRTIEFTSFSPLGSSATAEGRVTTAFRFEKEGGRWALREARVGDQQWVNVRDLTEALDQVRTRRTREAIQEVDAAVEKYRAENGGYPAAEDFVDLIDKLAPRYLSRVIRLDGWGRELRIAVVRGKPAALSDGPDGKAGTADDVKL